ncbi:hypothetical protein HanXRQr2_Chr03g0112171 [Helianthus annuus]|uniref:Uncharacterized protein n=1 Tax=Helianthus annuus TaxID=4232 RepID=A0A9K3JGI3_HELAN|nr:hypothetical protein HanXRQr2_Chr03g0112171 [Helianthus annuus]
MSLGDERGVKLVHSLLDVVVRRHSPTTVDAFNIFYTVGNHLTKAIDVSIQYISIKRKKILDQVTS